MAVRWGEAGIRWPLKRPWLWRMSSDGRLHIPERWWKRRQIQQVCSQSILQIQTRAQCVDREVKFLSFLHPCDPLWPSCCTFESCCFTNTRRAGRFADLTKWWAFTVTLGMSGLLCAHNLAHNVLIKQTHTYIYLETFVHYQVMPGTTEDPGWDLCIQASASDSLSSTAKKWHLDTFIHVAIRKVSVVSTTNPTSNFHARRVNHGVWCWPWLIYHRRHPSTTQWSPPLIKSPG